MLFIFPEKKSILSAKVVKYFILIKNNVTVTNYFTIFLQNIDMTNFLLVFIINITFSFNNNYLPHQQFVNFFVK